MEQLGRQGPELAAAQQELERLRVAEADLSRTAERQRSEMAALRASHQTELEAVISAQATTAEILRSERDAAITARTTVQA